MLYLFGSRDNDACVTYFLQIARRINIRASQCIALQ